ncbi:MAG: hypothetical protein EXR99_11580 [Gemmataceae bacterium]|nr:hypothetical protein [Gemmataceae bacterium]
MTSVRDFGAKGDGLTDDTQAIQHAVEQGQGEIYFPRGTYVLTQSVRLALGKSGPHAITGEGGASRVLMKGRGPAFHAFASHSKPGQTAQPESVLPLVWEKERMPLFQNLEIAGAHPEAVGILLEGCMQPLIRSVLIRKCLHGIQLKQKNRNVLISDCQLYDLSGIGVFLDQVNLHQINITGSHISYCKKGGIVIEQSEVRNIQITGNDIEYNFDPMAKSSADIFFDCSKGTVREGTIVGNTIQAKGSPGGANIRLVGKGGGDANAVGLLAITGNLIGSQETAIHLIAARGVTIAGNCIYSGYDHALWAQDSEHIVLGSNSFDHNPEYQGPSTDCLRFDNCSRVQLTGLVLQHTRPTAKLIDASISFDRCAFVQVASSQIHQPRTRGILFKNCHSSSVSSSLISAGKGLQGFECSIEADAACKNLLITNNFLAEGSGGALRLPKASGSATGNME